MQHSPSTTSGSSTYLLKPGLIRDSPGIFLLAGKAETAPLFFLGLGSASVRTGIAKGQLVARAALHAPAHPGGAPSSPPARPSVRGG